MSTTDITFRCWECGHPIYRWTGYVCVDVVAAQAKPPELVPWRAYHYRCNEHLDHSVYWFDVCGLRTTTDLIDRATRLAAEEWFAHTDWPVFASKAA